MLIWFSTSSGEKPGSGPGQCWPAGVLVSALGEPSREKAMRHGAHGVGYRAQANGGQLAEIGRLIDQGKVRPVVMATYPLAEARQAHERLERGHLRGKIVLVVTE